MCKEAVSPKYYLYEFIVRRIYFWKRSSLTLTDFHELLLTCVTYCKVCVADVRLYNRVLSNELGAKYVSSDMGYITKINKYILNHYK